MAQDTESRLVTTRQPDAEMVISADYRLDAQDRRKMDRQIVGMQTFLAKGLLNAVVGSYFVVDPNLVGGIKKGDCLCHAERGVDRVVRADASNLARTGAALAIAMDDAAPGSVVFGGMLGYIPRSVTGLATNLAGMVRVSSAGRCERVESIGEDDSRVGSVNISGTLQLDFRGAGGGGGGSEGGGLLLGEDPPENVNALAAYVGDSPLAAPLDHKHDVDLGTPVDVGDANATGSGPELAAADHVHAHGEHDDGDNHALVDEDDAGFAPELDGASIGSVLTKTATGVVGWAVPSVVPPDSDTGTFPSDDDPLADVPYGSEGPGAGLLWSRWDHTHPGPFKVVRSIDDLPAAVSGERTLTPGILWFFVAHIDIGTDTLVIPDNVLVVASYTYNGIVGSGNPICKVGAFDREGPFYVARNGGSGVTLLCTGELNAFENWTVFGKMEFRGGAHLYIRGGHVSDLDIYDGNIVYIYGTKMGNVRLMGEIANNMEMVGVHQQEPQATGPLLPLLIVASGVRLISPLQMVGCSASDKLLVLGPNIADSGAKGMVQITNGRSLVSGSITLTSSVVPGGGMVIEESQLHTTPFSGFDHLTAGVTSRANRDINGALLPETPNGHIIRDDLGVDWPMTHKMRVAGATVSQSGGVTIITPGTGGVVPQWTYLWSTSLTAGDRGSGKVGSNSASPGSITRFDFSNTTNDSGIVPIWMSTLAPGQRLKLSCKVHQNHWHVFEVISVVASSTWTRVNAMIYNGNGLMFDNNEPLWLSVDASRSLGLRGGTMDPGAPVEMNSGTLTGVGLLQTTTALGTSGVIYHQSVDNDSLYAEDGSLAIHAHSVSKGFRTHFAKWASNQRQNVVEHGRRTSLTGAGAWAVKGASQTAMAAITVVGANQFQLFLNYSDASTGPFGYAPGSYTGPVYVKGEAWVLLMINGTPSTGRGWCAKYVVHWDSRGAVPSVHWDEDLSNDLLFPWPAGFTVTGTSVALIVSVLSIPAGGGKLYSELVGDIIAAPYT